MLRSCGVSDCCCVLLVLDLCSYCVYPEHSVLVLMITSKLLIHHHHHHTPIITMLSNYRC